MVRRQGWPQQRPLLLAALLLLQPIVSEAFAQGSAHAFVAREALGLSTTPIGNESHRGLRNTAAVAARSGKDSRSETASAEPVVSGPAGKSEAFVPTPAPVPSVKGEKSRQLSAHVQPPVPLEAHQDFDAASDYTLADDSVADDIRANPVKFTLAFFILLFALPIHWFNEQRSAKMDTLLARGVAECVTLDPYKGADPANRGRLVHVQGSTRAVVPLVDDMVPDARVDGCLKLQRTVEVFEWLQTTRTWMEGRERRMQPRFETAWTTTHYDSGKFRKPSPENPRLPSGIQLGTETRTNEHVDLGAFSMPSDLVSQTRKFELAIQRLPQILSCHGLTFVANPADGYFYARPGLASVSRAAAGTITAQARLQGLFNEPQVGDLRVRFMCVPEGDATVVAVQCERAGRESFVPYRAIERSPCDSCLDERERLVDEGLRPLKELRGMGGPICCTGGLSGCCCCPCQVISVVCTSEVVTEEIYFASERIDPKEKPFQWVVPRNRCRVLCFRLSGIALVYVAVSMLLAGPFEKIHLQSLEVYGREASLVLAALLTFALSAFTMASARIFYQPAETVQWVCVAALIVAGPVTWASYQVRPEP